MRTLQRPHFWLPRFFARTLDDTPRKYPILSNLQAMVGGTLTPAGGNPRVQEFSLPNVDDCMRKCNDVSCPVVSYGNDGQCRIYTDRTLELGSVDNPHAVATETTNPGPHGVDRLRVERERRIFGDGLLRNSAGTGEFTTQAPLHRGLRGGLRPTPGAPRWRTARPTMAAMWCSTRGAPTPWTTPPPTGPVCRRSDSPKRHRCHSGCCLSTTPRSAMPTWTVSNRTPSAEYRWRGGWGVPWHPHRTHPPFCAPDRQLDLQKDVLGELQDQTPGGMCGIDSAETVRDQEAHLLGGSRIRSKTCQRFCQNHTSRANGYCAKQLSEYCASETEPGFNEDSCNCWMTDEAYQKVLLKQQEDMALTSETAQKINEAITRANMKSQCWYTPCNASVPAPVRTGTAPAAKSSNGPPDGSCPPPSGRVSPSTVTDDHQRVPQRDHGHHADGGP